MRYHSSMIQCDADWGLCGAQSVDYYEGTASTVNGIAITRTARAPGWRCTDDGDYCPDHADRQGADHG